MPRESSVYRCQTCGFVSPKPGTCPDCARRGDYIPLVEELRVSRKGSAPAPASQPVQLSEISADSGSRIPTGIGELDRVLGGGVVRAR